MRFYHFKNIAKNILNNWKLYLILLLELCLCFFLIYIGINERISHEKRAELLSYDQNDHIHTLQYQDKVIEYNKPYNLSPPLFNPEELKIIEANRDIEGFYYTEISYLSYYLTSNSFRSILVVVANRSFFKHYLNTTNVKEGYCYLTPELLSEMKNEFLRAPFAEMKISGDSIILDEKSFEFQALSSEDLMPVIMNYPYQDDVDPKNAIFFLKDENDKILGKSFEINRVHMKYKTFEKNLEYSIYERFLEQLSSFANEEFLFSELYINQLFKKGGDELNGRVRNFGWAGQVAFFIVVVGISGIFILIIQKRYKQLCICHINGLTKRGAFMQIFIEVLLLVSIPSIIGMILVITFQGKFNSIYYPIEWHPFTTVVFILLPIVITLIVTVVSSSWLRHLNVVKWLKRIE